MILLHNILIGFEIIIKVDLMVKSFIFIQVSMVSIKLDNLLILAWKDVFWPFWIFFSIMVGINLGFAIILVGKFYQKCISNVDNNECLLF